jgi:hypothetical protein
MKIGFVVLAFIFFLGDCSTITYKVIRKQNMHNTDLYREIQDRNHFFVFGFLPFYRKSNTYRVCKNMASKTFDMERKGEGLESYPLIVRTKYSYLPASINTFFFPLYSIRNIYVYCAYE